MAIREKILAEGVFVVGVKPLLFLKHTKVIRFLVRRHPCFFQILAYYVKPQWIKGFYDFIFRILGHKVFIQVLIDSCPVDFKELRTAGRCEPLHDWGDLSHFSSQVYHDSVIAHLRKKVQTRLFDEGNRVTIYFLEANFGKDPPHIDELFNILHA